MLGRFLIENLSINEEGGLDFEVSLTHQHTDYGSYGQTYPVTISSDDLEQLSRLFVTALAQKRGRESVLTKHHDPAPRQNPPVPSAQD